MRLIGLMRPERSDLWVILVFSLIVGVLALATPVAVEALVNTVAFGRYLQPVVVLALFLFTFLAFAAAIRGLTTYIVEILQRRLFVRVVEDLAYRLPRVEQREFDNRHGPELVNRFLDVVTVQKAASALLIDGIAIVLQTAIGMIVLAFYHPFLLGFDAVLLLIISFIVFVLGRGAVNTATKESKAKFAVAAWLEELARHVTAFKLHSGNQFALERADQLAIDWLEARRRHFRIVMRQIIFALGLQALAGTALLGLGGWLVIQGELTLGQLVAAELIVMMIVGSFAKLGKHMESFYDLLASVDKLGLLFDLSTESHDKLFHLREDGAASITARGVNFKYDKTEVLREVDLELQPGDSVALLGQSGSGKTTLIDLLCGLRTPDSGHVELDGIDLRDLRPDSLRQHLAVSRSVDVFNGTIDENVHLNRPNVRSSDVCDALQAVGLLGEIQRLPEGLGTVLQTNGAPLTSSQSVRLMLARAIVGRPRLLLIDGTLDALSDAELGPVLENLIGDEKRPWTVLVTTGRRAVIEACNRVAALPAPVPSRADDTTSALS
ncbi:MAG: ATP-binding cassette domain-containing protein [Planctomycetota bacterium]|nr:MAG: ATP-binding cassette domain-containing protein [Planctomycetota bacterium]REJ91441.1 MAG: ATP-binding cassette domain-containing protein [Planctomycetota bacterium]REK18536.1 MAG: ATP-binding cassette domain-containing protein [Planctomycetota bacterium]REK39514.1 MAG: ATP-binding cassette domain-containing protein [Planctomycetota bacterium]